MDLVVINNDFIRLYIMVFSKTLKKVSNPTTVTLQQIERYALFAHFTWSGSTSLPLAEKDLPFALASEIPHGLSQCTKLTLLNLGDNKLAGKIQQESPCCNW